MARQNIAPCSSWLAPLIPNTHIQEAFRFILLVIMMLSRVLVDMLLQLSPDRYGSTLYALRVRSLFTMARSLGNTVMVFTSADMAVLMAATCKQSTEERPAIKRKAVKCQCAGVLHGTVMVFTSAHMARVDGSNLQTAEHPATQRF
jgi:hypothetical protein